ncbi:MAG: prolipoprotein diacylglyceryl transferase [Candidatus Eisenbacteria bacterium]|nr:prolipoprotein diacylglyceryl transferase [Candidatus Eisenbacteria bacterium]
MQPILWQIGPIKIHAYGLCLALAFLIGGWLTTRRGERHGLGEREMTNYITVVLISSLIGARIYYVLAHPDAFAGRWGSVVAIWRGGLVLQGGIIAAALASWSFARRHGWRLGTLADVVAPSLALGEAIGRVGCFLNGCCYGQPAACPWAVAFPEGSPAHSHFSGTALHPTQLYLVVLQGAVAAALLLFHRSRTLRARYPVGSGGIFGFYLAGSSAVRFVVDLYRYYEPGDRSVFGWAHSQVVALVFFAVGLFLILRLRAGREGS